MSGRPSRAEDQGADDAVVADSEAFEAQDPGDGALDHQAVSIQMSFGLDPTAGNTHFDAWAAPWLHGTSAPIAHTGGGHHQEFEETAVVGVGGRGVNVQGQAVAVSEQVVLGARVRVVGGVRAGQLAPLFWARTDTEPMLAPAQSRICFSASSSSTARWGFSQTPAACHSRRRNQAVCPDPRPRVGGRAATDTEVCSTNKMPCTAARSSIRGRLPGPRGGGRGGMSGAISSHSRSSTAASSWPYRNGHPAGRGRSTIGQVLRTDVR